MGLAARPGAGCTIGVPIRRNRGTVVANPPKPFEVHESGAYLHGTKAELKVGDRLVPGRESNFDLSLDISLSTQG